MFLINIGCFKFFKDNYFQLLTKIRVRDAKGAARWHSHPFTNPSRSTALPSVESVIAALFLRTGEAINVIAMGKARSNLVLDSGNSFEIASLRSQ